MKIAILTSGILPIPAVQGGAVENLIDFYLEHNNQHRLHDITIYSVYHPDVENHPAIHSDVNHYEYFHVDTWWDKIMKRVHHFLHKEEYYHYTIEYFFDLAFRKIKKSQYDIIILENRPYFVLKMIGNTNARIVCHQHTDTLSTETFKHKEVYNSISKFITVSDFIANRIKTINKQDTKCQTVHNGIDLKAFSLAIDSNIRREDIGLKASDFVVVYSGRIMPKKGITELIEAIRILKDEPNIKLLIIGSSFYANAQKEDNFIRSLKEKAQPVNDRIIFTGYIPYIQIPAYLKLADVAAIPSLLNDAFPTTVLEAQAMGLPIITTNYGGIPEALVGQRSIILDRNGNLPHCIANAIIEIQKHNSDYQGNYLNPQFTKEVYALSFLKAIEDIQ